jgi:peptidylprolyl isomerase
MRAGMLIIAACVVLAFAGCGGGDSSSSTESSSETSTAKPSESASKTKPKVEVPSGSPPKTLVSEDLIEGSGAVAEPGNEVTVNYVGVDFKTGEQFDASWDRGEPITFTLGAGEVIPGWDEGIAGMKVGGRRELVIPPQLAYGSQGYGPIAPNSTLVFVVDLLKTN